MITKNHCITGLSVCFIACQLHAQTIESKSSDQQQFSSLGDFALETGEKIYDCTIGYRTYGKPNADKSNFILFPTWLGATSLALEQFVPGKLIDTTAYYLMVVDALGDGVSSSPSNSSKQPRLQFPKFSIRDMVESQYQLLTKHMGIQHVYAIASCSMGGHQSFQWAISHPGFADKIIPIVSTPQNTAYDLLLFRGFLEAIISDTAYHDGNYIGNPSIPDQSIMWNLVETTPQNVANTISRDSFETWLMKKKAPSAFDLNDARRQLEAIAGHDISKNVNGSLEEAGKLIKAKMLIILSKQDHVVNPLPSTKIAGIIDAKVVMLDSDYGHLVIVYEIEKIATIISEFLSEE